MKTKTAAKTKLIDALSARVRFGEVMDEVEAKNTRFLVSRRGKPKAVLMSVDDYMRNILKERGLLAEIQLTAEEAGLSGLGEEEVETEIKAYRRAKSRKNQ
jgi:prevent-host-death family protein